MRSVNYQWTQSSIKHDNRSTRDLAELAFSADRSPKISSPSLRLVIYRFDALLRCILMDAFDQGTESITSIFARPHLFPSQMGSPPVDFSPSHTFLFSFIPSTQSDRESKIPSSLPTQQVGSPKVGLFLIVIADIR